jgi:hypothetical protein
MPLPANVTTVTVLGTFLTPEGDPSTGTISFTASSWLTNSGANVAIPNSTVTKTLGTAGNFSVSLPITDDPDISPSGFVYNVSEVVDGVSQNYNISIPGTIAGGGTLYLADLAPVAPAGPEYYSLASSLTIGTVTTVATGGSATASITGLAPSQVLNLGIPTGATGTVASAGSGSVGTAAVAPTGDPNTGIYFPAADQVAVTTGGTQALLLSGGAVSNPTFSGVASFPDGSATAPSITNTGDTNTGLLFPSADTVAVTTAGTQAVVVTSLQRLGVNLESPASQLHVFGTGTTQAVVERTSDSAFGPNLALRKSRGTSETTRAIVSSGDPLGAVTFAGHDGSGSQTAVRIVASVDGTPGAGDMPGRLAIETAADGGTTLTERLRIDSNGLITGTGTSLGAWTAYTPTLSNTWDLGNGTTAAAYMQLGKLVIARVGITLGSTTTFGASTLTFSLPVNQVSGVSLALTGGVNGRIRDASASKNYQLTGWITGNTVQVHHLTTSGEWVGVSSSAPFTWADGDSIVATIIYQSA